MVIEKHKETLVKFILKNNQVLMNKPKKVRSYSLENEATFNA